MVSDADWAADLNQRHSSTGWVAMFSGAAISWASKRQRCIATSTRGAEYVAGASAAREAIWLRNFINELQLLDYHVDSVPIFIDNNAALRLTHNPEGHGRAKHIDIKYHFIREAVSNGTITTHRVDSKDSTADISTKPLPRDDFTRHVAGLGMSNSDCDQD